jgi:hypothetical protein
MRKFLRWLFSRKPLVRFAFVLMALLTLIIVAYYVERWRGERAWNAYRTEAEKRGTKLWLTDFVGPKIPDAINYAAIPLIEEAFRAEEEKRPARAFLPNFSTVNKARPTNVGLHGAPPNLKDWRDYIAASGAITEVTEDPAADLLAFLHRNDGLQQLREAGARPGTHFRTPWERGFATPISFGNSMILAGRFFQLSASVHLAKGDSAGAAVEIGHLFRMHEALCTEPSLIVGLIRLSILDLTLSAIHEGCAAGKWSDADLAFFERKLTACNLLAELRLSIGSERGGINFELNRISQMPPGDLWDLAEMFSGVSGSPSSLEMALYPRGWVRFNMVQINEYFDSALGHFEPVNGHEREVIPAHGDTDDWFGKNVGTSGWSRFRHLFVNLVLPSFYTMERKFLAMHARVAQARIACALERHRLAHQTLPEKLEALVPQFLPAVPKDICDGQTMRYRRDETGYLIWSVATDRADDGGAFDEKQIDAPRQKDWVWKVAKQP